jgi:hypothetical protein
LSAAGIHHKIYGSVFLQHLGAHPGKKRGKLAGFTIKERQSFPAANHYLIVFNAYSIFLD